MIRRLAVLVLVAAALAPLPHAEAVELGLAGIRLGQSALDLLDEQGYGSPDFIGPAGAVTTFGITAPVTPGAARPGAAAPGAGYGAASATYPRAGYQPAGALPGRTSAVSRPTAGSGMPRVSFGGLGRRDEERRPPRATTARPSTMNPGFGAGRTTRPAVGAGAPLGFGAAGAPRPQAGLGAAPARQLTAAAPEGGISYWLYNKGGGVQVVVGIEADGNVNTVILSGRSYPSVKTEGNVRLGDSYQSVLDKYGFPDSTQNMGDAMVLRYSNAGLTLTLRQMRVQTIALAQPSPFGEMLVPGATARPATGVRRTGVRPLGPSQPGVSAPRATTGRSGTTRLRLRFGRGRRNLEE